MASVAAAHNINVPAASMRLTRLRKHLDSLAGQQGRVGAVTNDAIAEKSPKAPETPKAPKSEGVRDAAIKKEKNEASEVGALTPTPIAVKKSKTKKRKIAEMEDAGIEQFQGSSTKGYGSETMSHALKTESVDPEE